MIRARRKTTRRKPRWWIPVNAPAALAGLFGLVVLSLSVTAAEADFRVCNTTNSLVGVALGHNGPDGWTTDGWWNLEANSCRTLLRGDLTARYYYVYAIDYELGGEWSGESYMCTRDQMFTIVGFEDCEARGYVSTGFFEVDTREQRSWTVRLTDPASNGTSMQ